MKAAGSSRSTFPVGMVLVSLLVIASTASAPALADSREADRLLPAASWSQFHHDPRHDGLNPDETILSPSTVGGLQLAWSTLTGLPVTSSPAIANGVVYIGSRDGNLYALSAATGAVLWTLRTGAPIDSSPAVSGGLVFVGSGDSMVYAAYAKTGATAWTFSTGAPVGAPIIVSGGTVFVSSYLIYALDAATGALLWSSPGSGKMPAVSGSTLFVPLGPSSNRLKALDTSNGAVRWSVPIASETFSSPAVANGAVYLAEGDETVAAYSAATGALLWSTPPLGHGTVSSPAVANGVLYIGSSEDGVLFALDAANGTVLWSHQLGPQIHSSPAVANGVVYVGSFSQKIYALDATTGVTLWSFTTSGYIESSPAVVNGYLFVGSDDRSVRAFHL